jgi:acyl-coenzyme A synthetase/AMP-(fatty) acid ligase
MLEAGGLEECLSLREAFCGGEALKRELQDEALKRLPCGLTNLYGPTEATIQTVVWRCKPGGGLSAPIGRPIANTKTYVLDSELELVPPGVAAELYIAGRALGRGYWNKPELTADRFIPNPFGRDGERMYRTGDLTRHLDSGSLVYLERTDHQVKVRGLRIELGEIEEALRQHQAVRQAVVMAREDDPGVKRLVAYIVSNGGPATNADELLNHLRKRLPDYMQPSACVMLDAMPLTPNGKIDRRALPKPEIKVKGLGHDAPRNAVEEALCGIWSQVLGVEPVGVEDNFFKLG